ncbi:hypothetical protein F5148DRAFT_990505 [Russula earlei]|uniref:Uncharacterized protein n=1 Tax=Russula earlei TaxID=71964 RepID=A0ACC0TR97_9AGAM|nr:hypothetical protein F5148DRAFT_990505 [Russula earlei]
MKALIIGATGATGKDLVQVLLNDPEYTQVTIFVRRPSGVAHAKLIEVVTDFDNPENVTGFITGDVLFSCLGTTLKAAGSKEKQWQTDYEIPAHFAEVARKNGVSRTVLLSAYGASAQSRIFYSRIKGTLEDKLTTLAFEQYLIFRPGLLLRKDTDRAGERISAIVIQFLNSLGMMQQFRPLPTAVLAAKMAEAPKVSGSGKHVIALGAIAG